MIVEWFIGVLASVVDTVLGWVPDIPVPTWVTSSTSLFSTLFTFAGSMGSWFPLTIGSTVAAAVLACLVVGFTLKVVRIVASFFTAGGGSAG